MAISAPAENAVRSTNAMVGTLLPSRVSRICSTASSLPPGVSISSRIAAAPSSAASSTIRSRYGASPRSIVPLIGTT
jgi:hypothetical protein